MKIQKFLITICFFTIISFLGFLFNCTNEKSGKIVKKNLWQIKVLSTNKQELLTENGGKIIVPNNIEIKFEITYNGKDSLTLSPSDFILIDSDDREFNKPALGGFKQTVYLYKDRDLTFMTIQLEDFKIGPGERLTKNFQYSISDSSKGLWLKFKNLPHIKIR